MLALEEVYDVIIVKDGQEAYDTVKTNMEKGEVFDLIFMDIQVWLTALGQRDILTGLDAYSRRTCKYTNDPSDGIFRTHCCT
jgi:CheY-like chemotaxis protein